MRQLPSELTEPAAPGTPEPGRLLNEGPGIGGAPAPTADAANKHRPSDAALQAALRGNQALFQGEVRWASIRIDSPHQRLLNTHMHVILLPPVAADSSGHAH